MRFSTTLLVALPAIVAAQQQKPLGENLQSWFEKAKSYIPTAATEPVAAGAAKVASKNITPLTHQNWQSVLAPSESPRNSPEEWMILVSGGNKTCYGRCDRVEKAFNETASVFVADPTAPNLGSINCDDDPILCSTWATGPPAIWHIQLPIPHSGQSTPATTIRIVKLNSTTTTTGEITAIHTGKTYEKVPVYEGAFHPFDGLLAQYNLNIPAGHALYYFSLIPSWLFMIVISMVSRNFMSRRMGQGQQPPRQGAAPQGGAATAN